MLPIRKFVLPKLDEYSLGALCMHSILECILVGLTHNLSIFTQPSVDNLKKEIAALIG